MDFLHWLENTGFSSWVRESPSIFAFPVILLIHTIGMGLCVGVSAGIDMRILGFAPSLRLAPFEKYFPILWLGFWMNAVTGTILVMQDASAKLTNVDFYVKMIFIALALVNLRMIRKHVFQDPQLDNAPFRNMRRFRGAVFILLAWRQSRPGVFWLTLGPSGR
jgi:hypothetical protein